jgi:hypothetical protein
MFVPQRSFSALLAALATLCVLLVVDLLFRL